MTLVLHPALSRDLTELVARATAAYSKMTPSARLRHRYMQRRSFALSFGGPRANVDRRMPHEAGLSDAEIGLILIGEKHGQ